MDEKDVQDGAVPEGDASSDGTSTTVATPALTKEEVEGMFNEFSKRMKQSTDDRIKAERGRSQGVPTPDYGNVLGLLGDADPEVKAKAYENALQQMQAQQHQAAQQEQGRLAAEQFESDWRDNVVESLVELGIDPEDKGVNWGDMSESKLARQKKIYASAAKLVKGQLEGSATKAKKEADEKVAQAAKDAGLESNTAVSGAAISSKAFTRQQIAAMSYEDYKANAADIDAANLAGNIK